MPDAFPFSEYAMIFQKKAIDAYREKLFSRADDSGLVKFFSYHDFPGLTAVSYPFLSSHGHTLQGYFYAYPGADASRLIVFDHGLGGGHRSYMKEIELLCRRGCRIFAYDHTGCMESGGANTGGLAQSLCDLNDALNTLKADGTVLTEDISVIGHSWGGYATLNIPAFHPDIKRIVVLSGGVSVGKMLEQFFPGPLKGYRKAIYAIEHAENPTFVDCDGIDALRGVQTAALLLYSDNDPYVSCRIHYRALADALSQCPNVTLRLLHNKGHNVTYSDAALVLLDDMRKALKSAASYRTEEEKAAFRNSFDWDAMTEQDPIVWEQIFTFLHI